MATNATRWVKNTYGPHITGPLLVPGKFQAGATQAVKRGELLELSSGNFIPLDADQAMSAIIAIAHVEVKSGDLAGYHPIIVPRPGDVFEFELAAAGSSAIGTAVYWSSSEKVTITAGTNILGHIYGWDHYPYPQGHQADDASFDRGTTIRSHTRAHITIKASVSYYAALQL